MESQNDAKASSFSLIEKMLAKPSKKPDFSMPLQKPSVLSQLKQFLPDFVKSTNELVADESLRQKYNIDIEGVWESTDNGSEARADKHDLADGKQYIEINMGVGIYDINNPDFNEHDFKPQSLNPWFIIDDKHKKQKEKVLVKEMGAEEQKDEESDESSDSSDSSDSSENEESEIQSQNA